MESTTGTLLPLSSGARMLAVAAELKQEQAKHPVMGLHHWLLVLLERHGPLVESLSPEVKLDELRSATAQKLLAGDVGPPLDGPTLASLASDRARSRGKEEAFEQDLALVVLDRAGLPISTAPAQGTGSFQPRCGKSLSSLERFGRDLTHEAQEGKLPPLYGRGEEIDLVVETLCRRTKRNPVLVGPPGVGKTAIVEGLAGRIVQGRVPEVLRGARLFGLQPSNLVAGIRGYGDIEERVKQVLDEAANDGVLLFIDELHCIVGTGGIAGRSDIASLLKPALSRGEIACIAATTDEEYRLHIEPDGALERRFQPVRVQELTPADTLQLLHTLRDEIRKARGVDVPDTVLQWLVDFAQSMLRNRYFPDKAVDLLEQCTAYAISQGLKTVGTADAVKVAQRLVGMPLEPGTRIAHLRNELNQRSLLDGDDTRTLLSRLEVTVRGLDLRSVRPNAVILLLGEACNREEALAETIAVSLFGGADRQVSIDFSRFTSAHDVTLLLGAPPGYIGFSESLPLHRVTQMPWCVLRCQNLHACHPSILEVLRQALAEGFFTDSRSKRIYLSDVVVLATAPVAQRGKAHPLGFQATATGACQGASEQARDLVGKGLIDQFDLVCSSKTVDPALRKDWLRGEPLQKLSERFARQGIELRWEEGAIDWMIGQLGRDATQIDWEHLIDQKLLPLLVPHVSGPADGPVRLEIRCEQDGLQVGRG